MTGTTSAARIAIVGAGIGGCALGAMLQRIGHDVRLFEQAPAFARVGAGIHLSPNLMRVMRLLGVHRQALWAGQEPDAFANRQAADGELLYRLPLGEHAIGRFGATFVTLKRGDLHAALLGAVAPGTIAWGKRLAGLDPAGDAIRLTFEDGSSETADLVIGADGLRSRVREALRGFEAPEFSGQVAFRGAYPRALLGELAVEDLTKWWGDRKFVLSYWLDRARREFYFAAMTPQAEWPTQASSMPGDVDEMQAIFADFHPAVRHMLARAPRESVMKWALFERSPQFEFGNERVVLIGDACHPMRPFMSQGAAMALEDATILLRALIGSSNAASAFSTYAQCRVARLGEVHRVSAANTFMHGPTEPDWVFGYDALTAHASAALPPLPVELDWLVGASPLAARMQAAATRAVPSHRSPPMPHAQAPY
ncbi:FAD-dependent monooxygenase [Burkholderia cepacia]|uniref:FAD-dependent monooxygenase n=1 Tax=Burkholderia cepacia TaxID=292 RepID=UPI001CF0F086|nr:FAD-dependent monooxygenase [Burkholderia cepacia]MCA8114644.1 FAD-dependent monooxygenase [Burkholderia cepacia]MCA8401820.1 FAD-dependent monooxygenase [Burkholderia cepacia]